MVQVVMVEVVVMVGADVVKEQSMRKRALYN